MPVAGLTDDLDLRLGVEDRAQAAPDDELPAHTFGAFAHSDDAVVPALFGGLQLVRLEALAVVLDRRHDLLGVVAKDDFRVRRARMLSHVPQAFADDPDDRALDEW